MTMAFKMGTYVKTAHQMLKTNKQTNKPSRLQGGFPWLIVL